MKFHELDTADFQKNTIFLDIDGTLGPDGCRTPAEEVCTVIKKFAAHNDVYLYSNKQFHKRDKELAAVLNINAVISVFKKPFAGALRDLPHLTRPFVVIGDKMLTDGLFAFNIDALFIKVHRYYGPHPISLPARIVEAVDDIISRLVYLVSAMRPVHWIKNSLILIPLFFASAMQDSARLTAGFQTLIFFTLLAGGIYLINDIADVTFDRRHPFKKYRPFAHQLISFRAAYTTAIFLCIAAFALAFIYTPSVLPLFGTYAILAFLYSAYLKHIPVLDVLVIALFYLIRILIGGAATLTPISAWLVLTVIFSALLIGHSKRLAEARHTAVRPVLERYTAEYLSYAVVISAALVLVSYGLYTVLEYRNPALLYSNIFALYGVFRYLYLVFSEHEGEFPESIMVYDSGLRIAVIAWLLCMGYAFYA